MRCNINCFCDRHMNKSNKPVYNRALCLHIYKILSELDIDENLSFKELKNKLPNWLVDSITERTIYRALKLLREIGTINKISSNKHGRYLLARKNCRYGNGQDEDRTGKIRIAYG